MIKRGKAPFLECSSKGDKRFSAFCAKVNGRSIEEQYQAFKIFDTGETRLNWREAKGRRAVNQQEAAVFYRQLWEQYIDENPQLKTVLMSATGLSDMFGQHGHVCQADVLWDIRSKCEDDLL